MNEEQEPKIIVDDDWKQQVQQEKEELEKQVAEESADSGEQPLDLPEASFSILVSTLSTQALASMGYIPDPVSGKPNVNKPMAKHFIDTLGVLQEKTAGNLDESEAALLKETLHQLRMAFIAPGPGEGPEEPEEPEKKSTIELP